MSRRSLPADLIRGAVRWHLIDETRTEMLDIVPAQLRAS